VNKYKDLKIWQKAVDLSVKVYEITRNFPKDEIYGLTSQMRRSSVSIAANIAEGSGRNSKKEFRHFLSIAYGSGSELETQLIISERNGFITKETLESIQADMLEIQKMNWALKRSLKTDD
jgi:four helix bundle protein